MAVVIGPGLNLGIDLEACFFGFKTGGLGQFFHAQDALRFLKQGEGVAAVVDQTVDCGLVLFAKRLRWRPARE